MERRYFIINTLLCAGGLSGGFKLNVKEKPEVLKGVQEFLSNVANPDGSYRTGIDPAYPGKSDTVLSRIAAPTYAIILSRTFGWELPYPDETKTFLISCKKPDEGFSHFPFEEHADVDAVYFQVGGLVESGYLKVRPDIVDEEILGWSHAMDPKKTYTCI